MCGDSVHSPETGFSLVIFADLSTNIGMRNKTRLFSCSYSEKKNQNPPFCKYKKKLRIISLATLKKKKINQDKPIPEF